MIELRRIELKRLIGCLAIVLMLTLPLAAGSELAAGGAEFMPLRSTVENYWDVTGSPKLDASVVGTNEFNRGDKAILRVALSNIGTITAFEPDEKPEDEKEKKLADFEFTLEKAKTVAFPITGELHSLSEYIEVQSGRQVIESLVPGGRSKDPMEFAIEVDNDAPEGQYPLALVVFYAYQENAGVGASDVDSLLGLQGFRQNAAFGVKIESINLTVAVKSKADFQAVDVDSHLNAGQEGGVIKVTYRNTGKESAKDALARISLFMPFSSADDQASLGTLEPGDEKTATFKLDVDEEAIAGNYSINTEVKYTDLKGNSIISETISFPVNVGPAKRSYLGMALLAVILLAAIGAYLLKRKTSRLPSSIID